jgi:hypothetical protein
MDLASTATAMAWFGVAVTGGIAGLCVRDPVAGLAFLTHRLEQLPQVMTDRYVALFGFSLFATLYGDVTVLAAWSLVLAFLALADAVIYARLGKPYMKHLSGGVAALVAFAVFLAALKTNGAA